MRFLADESCDFALVRQMRSAGHDVTAIVELSPRSSDKHVMELAVAENRIVITEDKDFGELFYARSQASCGVILIRFPVQARRSLAGTVLQMVDSLKDTLLGRFVVVQPHGIRVGRLPS